jgi:putative PIG3 family NAD(P)H quinone oxidoreductase
MFGNPTRSQRKKPLPSLLISCFGRLLWLHVIIMKSTGRFDKMKAVVMSGFGGPEVMEIAEVTKPEPGPNQVRVRVLATSVNRADIIQRQGHYPPPPGASDILGLEVAGRIDALGSEVSGWNPGDRVMGLVAGGGYAEYALVYAEHLLRIPETMKVTTAACVCETYITAYLNVFMIGGFHSGQSVLLHGGGGGVNTAALQICRALVPDGTIIVTASAGKLGRVMDLGGDLVIDYKAQDFVVEVKAFTRNRGVDLILDHIGADYLKANMQSLATGGRLVIIGVMGGASAPVNLAHLLVKRQHIIGSVIRSRSVAEKAAITTAFKENVLPLLSGRRIEPLIHRIYSIESVRDAHREMEKSRHFGKIVLAVQ